MFQKILTTLILIGTFSFAAWAQIPPASTTTAPGGTTPPPPTAGPSVTPNTGPSAPTTSDTMGVNPKRKATDPARRVPLNKKVPVKGATPSKNEMQPYENTTQPYDSTTHPGSDTIDDTHRRPGGLSAPTAQDQSTSVTDAETTRKIRAELMNRDLSMQAKNITIVTRGGAVVLRGEVPSNSERNTISEVAQSVSNDVRNELVIRK